MIVADANLVAYYYLPGPMQAQAHAVLKKDPVWFAPPIMLSEFRNILLGFIRAKKVHKNDAIELVARVETVFGPRIKGASSAHVMDLACASGCSAYDAEYAALAQMMGIKLVTNDKQLLAVLSGIAVSLEDFG